MSHSLLFLSDSPVRAEFEVDAEAGGAVSVVGRFNPSRPDGWTDRTYGSADEAADAIEEAVRATFGAGIMERTRLTRIMLHGRPTAIGEALLSRAGAGRRQGGAGVRPPAKSRSFFEEFPIILALVATFIGVVFPSQGWGDWAIDVIVASLLFQTIIHVSWAIGYGKGWEDRDRKEPPRMG